MKFRILLCAIAVMSALDISAQIKVITNGKVGIGTAVSPTSQLELGDSQWLKLKAASSTSGILFHETGTTSATDVEYGAKIFYDPANDRFSIVTKNVGTDVYGISIQRTYGRVGIGMTSPSYTLDVNGYVRATNVSVSSDSRLKTDIKDLDPSVLSKLNNLKAKTYKPMLREPLSFYTPPVTSKGDTQSASGRVDDPRNKTMIGYLAQDVQKLFPELVSEDEDGYLSLDYMGLIPILVEAIKDQQVRIAELEEKVTALSKEKTQSK